MELYLYIVILSILLMFLYFTRLQLKVSLIISKDFTVEVFIFSS